MTPVRELACLIDNLIMRDAAFACWFHPASEHPRLMAGRAEDILFPEHTEALSRVRGFVFAPFERSAHLPVIVLQPGLCLTGYDQIRQIDPDQLGGEVRPRQSSECRSTPPDDYRRTVTRAIKEIRAEAFSKVILSRRICTARGNESLGDLFLALHDANPGVFLFVVNLPKAGLWMGATPELLFRADGRTAETVSLAGTQPLRPDGQYCWFTKEIEEQAFVSRYILDLLHRFGISDYHTQGPQDVETAAVAHLKTTFRFSAAAIEPRLGEFVGQLSPTPAVCGLPRAEAARFIQTFEPHDRRYYTGFLGPWRLGQESGGTDLYVNLRSMEIGETHYLLYSGGGITARSDPATEWEETTQKSRTLLNAIERLQGRERESTCLKTGRERGHRT